MNARELLPESLGLAPGAWFRDSYPGAPFPRWLAAECVDLADTYDPDCEALWGALRDSIASGEIEIEDDPRARIGFLIHLMPIDGGGERTPLDEENEGWHAPETGLRKPALCPRGLPAVDVGDEEYEDLVPPASASGSAAEEPATSGREALEHVTLSSLAGGPLAVPLASAWKVARLVSFCNDNIEAEIQIEVPDASGPTVGSEIGRRAARRVLSPTTIRLEFLDGLYAWDSGTWEDDLVPAFEPIPAGTILDLGLYDPNNSAWGGQRYRGEIRDGVWSITETCPRLRCDTLAAALTLVPDDDDEEAVVRVACTDEAELERVRDAALGHWQLDSVGREGLTLTADDECGTGYVLALAAFWVRHREVWDTTPREARDRAMAQQLGT